MTLLEVSGLQAGDSILASVSSSLYDPSSWWKIQGIETLDEGVKVGYQNGQSEVFRPNTLILGETSKKDDARNFKFRRFIDFEC